MRLGSRSRFLLDLLFSASLDLVEIAANPRMSLIRNSGYEDCAKFNKDLKRMAERGLIERQKSDDRSKWVVSLTELGHSLLTHSIEPKAQWSKPWDGKWRMIVFDLPEREHSRRRDLIQWLKKRRFGMLQGSTWISPRFDDDWKGEIDKLEGKRSDFSFFEGTGLCGFSDTDFVRQAWKMSALRNQYQRLLDYHQSSLTAGKTSLQTESKLWLDAFEMDPFLPDVLLPDDYLGKKAHESRRTFLLKFGNRD